MSEQLYVYGVMRADEAFEPKTMDGVQRGRVSVIRDGDLAALVSPVAGDVLNAAREVRAHWAVLQTAIEDATVVPMRFGMVVDAETLCDQLLRGRAEHLLPLLAELRGTVQVAVKGDFVMEELLRELVAGSPKLARARERVRSLPADASYYDRIRLGELIAAAVEEQRMRDVDAAFAKLEPGTRTLAAEPVTHAEAAFNLAALIERRRQESFGKRVAALADELGGHIAIRYIGPLPPYSFAEADVDARSAAWA